MICHKQNLQNNQDYQQQKIIQIIFQRRLLTLLKIQTPCQMVKTKKYQQNFMINQKK